MSTPPEDPREVPQEPQEDPRERLRRLLASEDETLPDLPVPDDEPGGSPSDETIASVFSSLNEEEEESPKPPEPETTPDTPMPALDKDNMPLPRRVDEIDVGATRVSPAAYTGPRRSSVSSQHASVAANGNPSVGNRNSIAANSFSSGFAACTDHTAGPILEGTGWLFAAWFYRYPVCYGGIGIIRRLDCVVSVLCYRAYVAQRERFT